MNFQEIVFQKMQEKHKNNDEYKASKPLVTHYFWGAYEQQRYTWYLSGLADGQYRCLNIFKLIFENSTSTLNKKRNKGISGGGPAGYILASNPEIVASGKN